MVDKVINVQKSLINHNDFYTLQQNAIKIDKICVVKTQETYATR